MAVGEREFLGPVSSGGFPSAAFELKVVNLSLFYSIFCSLLGMCGGCRSYFGAGTDVASLCAERVGS